MAFNIKKQLSLRPWPDFLGLLYQLEQGLSGFIESLVAVNHVVYRNCPIVAFDF